MPGFEYRYELRRGEELVATGHLTRERPFDVGERVEIGGWAGAVRTVEPVLGERELRLVVQLWRAAAEPGRPDLSGARRGESGGQPGGCA
jgi:hypothetical protein